MIVRPVNGSVKTPAETSRPGQILEVKKILRSSGGSLQPPQPLERDKPQALGLLARFEERGHGLSRIARHVVEEIEEPRGGAEHHQRLRANKRRRDRKRPLDAGRRIDLCADVFGMQLLERCEQSLLGLR